VGHFGPISITLLFLTFGPISNCKYGKYTKGGIILEVPFVGGVHSSKNQCVTVYYPISMRFQLFFTSDCSFRCTTSFAYTSLRISTIFAKLRTKNVQNPKIGVKVYTQHFVY